MQSRAPKTTDSMNNKTTTAQQGPDDNQQRVPVPVLPAREIVTEHQVNVLLAMMHHFQSYLLVPPSHYIADGESLPPRLDGGAHAAAVSAFSAVCQKIEDLLAQKKRWNTNTHDQVYSGVLKLQQAHINLAKEQALAAQEIRKPSYCLKPNIRMVEGHFIATWGDPSVTGGSIVGHGATPRAALEDFNSAFERTPQEMIQFISSLDNPPPMMNNPHKKKREDDSQ